MGTKVRSRGDKEPAGRTKAAILLFLAEHGESTFTEVREHLLERYNIRSQKDIRIHLNDLSGDDKLGLADKICKGNGNACSYRIRGGFDNMRRLYNYLKAQGTGQELMRTRLFAEFTSSCDFFVQLKINVICNIMADLHRRMADKDSMASLIDCMGHIPPLQRDELIAWMERVGLRDMSDPLSRSFVELFEVTTAPGAERIVDAYVQRIARRGMAAVGPEGFNALASDVLIPDRYREPITAILQASPGAFDRVMNLDCDNPLFPRNPFMAYAISQLLAQEEMNGRPIVTIAECCEYAKGIRRVLQEPPIFVIARSHFVADLVAGRLAVKEVPEEMLRLIFS
jgi:hypothetical protein